MEPVTTVSGRAYPFGRKNVDTDVIIPAHYLKTISRIGLGKGAFETVRAEPGNVFDDPEYAGAPIIIAGDNFGCGSSREHAAWALNDMGVQAVIAPSFSDIFSSNAFKNGIVAVVLPQEAVDRLLEVAKTHSITVDLSGSFLLRDGPIPAKLPDKRARRDRSDAVEFRADRRLRGGDGEGAALAWGKAGRVKAPLSIDTSPHSR
jgi:3-isopropylmalate/(R)-2-methylmalate dehydratase small subunit